MVRVSFQSLLQTTIRMQHACAINPGDCIVEDVVASCLVNGEEDRFRRYISSSETDTSSPGESSPPRTDNPPALPPEKGGRIITITISDAGMSPGSSSLAAAVLLDLLYPFNSTSAPECRRKADGLSSTTKHPPDSTGCLTTLNAMFWTGRSLSNLG